MIPYESSIYDPDYCYDVRGNVISCPVVLPKAVHGLGSIADVGVSTLLATAVVGVFLLSRAARTSL